jgi:hypothetical protein
MATGMLDKFLRNPHFFSIIFAPIPLARSLKRTYDASYQIYQEAQMTGSIVHELGPEPGNPRNSEGAFIRAGDQILFCYSAFISESDNDHAAADIRVIRSGDQGQTWSAPQTVTRCRDHQAMNIMSVSLLDLSGGRVGLFYLVRRDWRDMRMWLRESSDGGYTWGEARLCMPRDGYFVVNNDRVVRLSCGRILVPAAEHVPTFHGEDRPHYSPATSTFFFSDDEGQSWREGPALLALGGVRSATGLQEPGVVELADGSLYGWARTDLSRQYQFKSASRGENWSMPLPSPFSSPVSPLSMKRLADGRLLALWNPVPDYPTRRYPPRSGGRSPLIAAVSADDGQHWTGPLVLEDDPDSGYCYTTIYEAGDAVLLAYCAGNVQRDVACLNRLRIRRLPLRALDGLPGMAMYGIG